MDTNKTWEIIMSTDKTKTQCPSTWSTNNQNIRFGKLGEGNHSTYWENMDNNPWVAAAGAYSRTSIKTGADYENGLYKAFFTKKYITKIALVDDSTDSMNPYDHTKYVIFDLTESEPQGTGPEKPRAQLIGLEQPLAQFTCAP